MSFSAVILVLVVSAGLAAFPIKRYLKRRLRVRRLEVCEANVAKAMADGRLTRATGEVTLQHLEGLRRECSGEGGAER